MEEADGRAGEFDLNTTDAGFQSGGGGQSLLQEEAQEDIAAEDQSDDRHIITGRHLCLPLYIPMQIPDEV